MPPEARVRIQDRFIAKIKGIVIGLPKSAMLEFTGEKLTCAIVGCPTVKRHQGTNTEIAISSSVETPANNAIKPILFCIKITF